MDPKAPIHAHPQSRDSDSRIHDNSAPVLKNENHDHGSKMAAYVATILASAALGGLLIAIPLMLVVMEARIQAGAAEANAVAARARTDARVAVDEIERMRTSLAARGIIIPKPEH